MARTQRQKRAASREAPKDVKRAVRLLIVVALAVVAYATAIGNSFVLDDVSIVVDNPVVRSIDLSTIFTSPYWDRGGVAQVADPTLYRPLTILSFAIDHALWNTNASAYHAVNILLHAATSALVFSLGLEVLGSMAGAFVAASLFAVHPVHTEAVTGIVGRADVLATVFFLLSLRVLRRRNAFTNGTAHPVLRSVLGAFLWLAGLLSKEMAVTMPVVLVVDDWLHRDALPAERAATIKSLAIRYAPIIGVAILYLVLRQNAVSGSAQIWPGFSGVQPLARILTASRVAMEYIALFVFPHALRADYWTTDVPIATSLTEPLVLLSLLMWVAITILLARYGKQNRDLAFGVGWFFITLAPVSNVFFPIGVAKAERLLYLPSVGLCLLAGVVVARIRIPASRIALQLTCAALLAVLTWRTVRRNKAWKDSFTLATATLAESPASPLMNDIAAGEFVRRGEAARALPLLQTAVREAPNLPFLHSHLGATYYALGMPNEAIAEYNAAIRLNPGDADAFNNLGLVYLDRSQDEDALAAFGAAIAARPAFAEAYLNLGALHFARGRMKEAEGAFSEAVRLNPANAEAHNNLGITLARSGMLDRAADHYKEALRINPGFEKARANLAALEQQRAADKRPP